ncbi:MAG: hypothetical protein IPN15_20380, partial [Saprospiraceae bacterium]|nr:hypothetical protein [Candidatus Vicinibacter affinis]
MFWDLNGKKFDTSGMYSEKYTNSLRARFILSFGINHPSEVCIQYNRQKHVNNTGGHPTINCLQNLACTLFHSNPSGCGFHSLGLDLKINEDFEKRGYGHHRYDFHTWPVNAQTYDKSGTYRESFRSTVGCDSPTTCIRSSKRITESTI